MVPLSSAASRPAAGPAREFLDALHDATHAVLARITPELEAEGLTHGKFWALYRLSDTGSGRVAEIARRLSVTMPSVTACVDQLVEDGLVRRTRSEADRRAVVLTVTPRGRRVVARVLERFDSTLNAAFAGVPPSEVRAASRLLREATRRLRRSAPVAPEAP